MTMLCYKNGSLAREAVRDASAHGSWSAFNDLLGREPPGNKGRIGFYHYLPEITPTIPAPRVVRFNADGQEVPAFDTPGVGHPSALAQCGACFFVCVCVWCLFCAWRHVRLCDECVCEFYA
jgi:hypothetical protein